MKNRGIFLGHALLFTLASNAAVLFVLKFGLHLWPERLPANSQNLFWLASGVNFAGLAVLGMRWWPVLLLNAFPAWWLAGEPLGLTATGAAANAIEAVLAIWAVERWGGFDATFDRVRTVLALLVASVVAPLANTLIMPAYFCVTGMLQWSDYADALGSWNLSNGAAMLIVAPLLLAIWWGRWNFHGRLREFIGLLLAAIVLCIVAFHAVFEGAATNFAFIVFPPVLYAAVRFGQAETSVVLGAVLVAIYGSLAAHAGVLPPDETARVIWFVQAFCWVLAATGLLIAAVATQRRQAEHRSLEISLREERARLDTLRYQLDPHFLFNSLNSIYSTLPIEGAETSRSMLNQLAGYLRSTLAGREEHSIPLGDELLSTEKYLAIEQTRFGPDLQVSITAGEAARACLVPAFLLQPLVENAIHHGFASTRGAFRLEITATIKGEQLIVEVRNTGTWKDPSPGGLGLENTRRRLAILGGSQASLDITSGEGWVRARIELPARR